MDMRAALLSLLMGLVVGAAYGLCQVRSPAPPVVALLGLLGMVVGEQACIVVTARWSVSHAAPPEHRATPTLEDRSPADPRRLATPVSEAAGPGHDAGGIPPSGEGSRR